MSIRLLSKTEYPTITNTYIKHKLCFPLILTVLQGLQSGQVMIFDEGSWALVVHKFGFAQIIPLRRGIEPSDEIVLEIFNKKLILPKKIRLLGITEGWKRKLNSFFTQKLQFFERVQFQLDINFSIPKHRESKLVTFDAINRLNLDLLEKTFSLNLASRFWNGTDSLLKNNISSVAYVEGMPASICYACALANNVAEIDILTHASFRNMGIGTQNVFSFLNKCVNMGYAPNWDCYRNNEASFCLAKKVGFIPKHYYTHCVI